MKIETDRDPVLMKGDRPITPYSLRDDMLRKFMAVT